MHFATVFSKQLLVSSFGTIGVLEMPFLFSTGLS